MVHFKNVGLLPYIMRITTFKKESNIMTNLEILNRIALPAAKAKEEKEFYVGSWIIDLYPEFKVTDEGVIVEGSPEIAGQEIIHTFNFGKVKLHILDPRSSLLLAISNLPKESIPQCIEIYCHIFGVEIEEEEQPAPQPTVSLSKEEKNALLSPPITPPVQIPAPAIVEQDEEGWED